MTTDPAEDINALRARCDHCGTALARHATCATCGALKLCASDAAQWTARGPESPTAGEVCPACHPTPGS